MTPTPRPRTRRHASGRRIHRRTESGTPPEAAKGHSPDGWEANHAVLARLAEHRVVWRPG